MLVPDATGTCTECADGFYLNEDENTCDGEFQNICMFMDMLLFVSF